MPLPTLGQVHVSRPLTNLSIAAFQEMGHFAADVAFPMVPVEYAADKYKIWKQASLDRDEYKVRAPSSESAGMILPLDSDGTYSCVPYALHYDVTDQIVKNADDAVRLEIVAAKALTLKAALRREALFAAAAMTTGKWATDKTGGSDFTKWDDPSSTPLEDIRDGRLAVLKAIGKQPNTLVLGAEVFESLCLNEEIKGWLKSVVVSAATPSTPALVSEETLAQLFHVNRVVVSRARANSAAEGAAAVNDFVVGKTALLCYVPDAPALEEMAAGYTFSWSPFDLVKQNPGAVGLRSFRMEHLRSTRIEGEIAVDAKVTAPAAGYFFNACVS